MMSLLRCSRCDQVGHTTSDLFFYSRDREAHADAQIGDNVPRMSQVQITISANSVVMEESQREVGWWENQRIEIAVGGSNFVLGRASGEGCNCLIYSFQQILPTSMFNVAFVRAELERRHAGRPTAIVRRGSLYFERYWGDIIDINGLRNRWPDRGNPFAQWQSGA